MATTWNTVGHWGGFRGIKISSSNTLGAVPPGVSLNVRFSPNGTQSVFQGRTDGSSPGRRLQPLTVLASKVNRRASAFATDPPKVRSGADHEED